MTALEQARAFAAMAVCGALGGAVFDAGMLFRRAAHAGRLAVSVMDILFGVAMSMAVTMTALHLRIEPFRLYVLLAVGLGLALWRVSVGAGIRHMLTYAGKRRSSVKKSADPAEEVPESGRK